MERSITFFASHVSTAKMLLASTFARQGRRGVMSRDRAGRKSQCIGCSYCIGACPYQVRYLNPVTKVADKCDFCAETRLAKGFPPICVSACPEHALIFGHEDSPEIQAWLQENKYYQYQLPGAGNRICIAGSVDI